MLSADELRQLVPAAKQGDARAMEHLCNSFKPLVFTFCRRQTLYNVLGEDAENTVWVLFLEALANFSDTAYESFPGFVSRHLANRVINIFRHHGYRFQLEQLSAMEDGCEASQIPCADDLQSLLARLSLTQELGKLPTLQAFVLEQYYCQNKTMQDIASTLHISPRTVRYHRQMALKALRKYV